MAKVIAVVGATGSQGGSVARALLKESKYKVRAITRNPMSEKAAALKKLGAEVVKADLDDMTSIVAALDGCYGLFSTTFHNVVQFDVNIEIRQGKTLADAAKATGIKHFIFSGARQVDDPKARSCAIYHGKLEVEDYINEIGIPMTCVMFATYMENYTNYRYHTKLEDGTRLFNIPLGDKAWDIISLADAGSAVSAVFDKPSEFMVKGFVWLATDTQYQLAQRYCPVISHRWFSKRVIGTLQPENNTHFRKQSTKMAKVIAVVGATGSQGGSVARALLQESRYKVRAITRNPISEKAVALKTLGAEVVKADLDDMASMVAALDGSYGLFSTTFNNDQFDVNIEIRQGKTMADAAKDTGIEHFIYSGVKRVDDAKARSCSLFQSKLVIEDYINEIGVPMTCVMFGSYMENYTNDLYPTKLDDGTLLFNIPLGDKAWDIISLTDAGSAISAVFDKPSEFIGKRIPLVSDRHSIPECAEVLSRHLSPIVFKASNITPREYSKLEFNGASEFATLYEYLQTEESKFKDGTKLTRRLNPEAKSFEQWVIANKESLRDAFR
ncbi:nmrA-like family domain-containing protein 1 [Ptychodera flava]|uniref:nmrA-like family domain-containing protein 1 n=1 Tax=Ptychodera flava TaxID=63121 RepID=UPI00396A74F5